jgi:hypothetical protein
MTIISFDEVLNVLCDEYDRLIAPKKIRRSNKNIIYLILKACAKGYELIANIIYALDGKFDPARCQDADLISVAKIVGTEMIEGNGSGLVVRVTNTNPVDAVVLEEGRYVYEFNADIKFFLDIESDIEIESTETKQLTAFSENKGSFHVTAQGSITLVREDEEDISPDIVFSCEDNNAILGSIDETLFEFRKRMLTDNSRSDILQRLELAIKNKPYIFEATLFFNQSEETVLVGTTSVAPYKMLITLLGYPRDEIAELVASHCIYQTVQVPENGGTLRFISPNMAGGAYEVHYKHFDEKLYDVVVDYRYDSRLILKTNIETEITKALASYKFPTKRTSLIKENIFYSIIDDLHIPSVELLNITLMVDDIEVPYIDINKTCIGKLDTLVLNGTDIV